MNASTIILLVTNVIAGGIMVDFFETEKKKNNIQKARAIIIGSFITILSL